MHCLMAFKNGRFLLAGEQGQLPVQGTGYWCFSIIGSDATLSRLESLLEVVFFLRYVQGRGSGAVGKAATQR